MQRLPRAKIQLYYDIISPYSYLAFETLTRYARLGKAHKPEGWDVDLELCPAALGGLHKVAGTQNITPAMNPYKRAYMHTEMLRLFAESGIEGSIPADHPSKDHNTLGVTRFLRILKDEMEDDVLESCSRRLFQQFFGAHAKPSEAVFLHTLCTGTHPLLTQEQLNNALQRSVEPSNKKRVIDEVEDLVKTHGAFGMPWIVVHRPSGETASFFGSDRFGNIAWWLGEGFKFAGPNPGKLSSAL
ncbi:thioredoxin-like protein [Exidia glandulosa HHB12029]|uniref:Thioredoxin-like protein n=1 Tax=Exidia glandulosa HHB12029 TaxID=1314781 RepID=A0A165EIX9_EXIGL|nr:thioredoxin-like protein [Exidia glandulosa HHB12029]